MIEAAGTDAGPPFHDCGRSPRTGINPMYLDRPPVHKVIILLVQE